MLDRHYKLIMARRSGGFIDKHLSTRVALSYALPMIPLMLLMGPIAVLQGIYAKYFGLSLNTIAAVILVARLFDAVLDPIIGYCAGRYYSENGSYRPFILCGGSLVLVAGYFLYVPPPDVTVLYFVGWFLAFYLSYTLFEIPHLAWGSSLCASIRDKNVLYSLRLGCTSLGSMVFYGLPLLPFFATNEITPITLKWVVLVAGIGMFPALAFCFCYTSKVPIPRFQHKDRIQETGNIRSTAYFIVMNRPLLMTLLASAFVYFSLGMVMALQFLFVDVYLGWGSKFAAALLVGFLIGMFSIKLWNSLLNVLSYHAVWVAAVVVVGIGMTGLGMLKPNCHWLLVMLWMSLPVVGISAIAVVVPVMLSNAADYGTWKFGVDQSAIFFSLYTLLNKILNSLGGALALALAGWYGFNAAVSNHSELTVFGLRLTMVWIPVILLLIGIFVALKTPISKSQHDLIRRRLLKKCKEC